MQRIKAFLENQSGASSMEYGLAALLISIVAIAAFSSSGSEVNGLYVTVDSSVDEVASK